MGDRRLSGFSLFSKGQERQLISHACCAASSPRAHLKELGSAFCFEPADEQRSTVCRFANSVTRDDHLLNLAGPLIDSEQACIAEETLDGNSTHVAGAPVNLHRSVGDSAYHLTAEVLGRRRSYLAVGTSVKRARSFENQTPSRIEVSHRIGDRTLNKLRSGDWSAGLLAVTGVARSCCHSWMSIGWSVSIDGAQSLHVKPLHEESTLVHF